MNCKHSFDFIITRRQLSTVFAGLLFLLFCAFISGYLMRIYVLAQREYVVSHVDLASEDQSLSGKNRLHSAELAAFGTYEEAQSFLENIDKKGFSLIVNEHKGLTLQGKDIVWYQVVTDLYEDKNELVMLVNQVRLCEQLDDVRFITLQG